MIGTSVRVGQDISFPRQTVFPHDTSYSGGNRGLMLRRRGVGRPFGVPGAQVAGEPELGDIGDAIGGGTETLGPGQEPGFPGGATQRATFIPPPPFPEQPPSPETDEFGRALAIGKAGLGVAGKLASLLTSKSPGTAVQRDEAAFQEQRAGERADLGGLAEIADVGGVPGGATQVPEFDLAGDLESSLNQAPGSATQIGLGDLAAGAVPGGATQVDIAADLEASFNPRDAGVPTATDTGGVGLGDVAGGVGAATGIAGTVLSDRPDLQKALIASAQAYPLAAEAVGRGGRRGGCGGGRALRGLGGQSRDDRREPGQSG